jgi:hypothetical protein
MTEVVFACAVCNQRVHGGEEYVNGVLTVTWTHGGPSDHEAVPAPATKGETTDACDFCGHTIGSMWLFTTETEFTVTTEADGDTFTAHHDRSWTSCHPCMRQIVARDGERLAHRAMLRIRQSVPGRSEEWYRFAKEYIMHGHSAFFAANPGAPERIRR